MAQCMDVGLLWKDEDASPAPTLKRARCGPHGCWRGGEQRQEECLELANHQPSSQMSSRFSERPSHISSTRLSTTLPEL